MWSHLGTHLAASRWPMHCPHPSCCLPLADETSFLFHLSDIHGLQMSPQMKKFWQGRRDAKPLLHWLSDTHLHKRTRQDGDKQERRPLKRSSRPVMTGRQPEWYPTHSLDPKDLGVFPISVSLKLSGVSLMNALFDDDLLPELSLNQSTLSPVSDETYLLDSRLYDNISPIYLMEELASKPGNAPTSDDKALFSQYLRSPSLPYQAEDDGSTLGTHTNLRPPTITPKDIYFSAERKGPTDEAASQSKTHQIQAKKPRITLRVHPLKPAPTPQVHLRLSRPKKAPAPTPVRPDAHCRWRKRI